VHSNLIDNSMQSLPTTPNFMLVNLFDGNLRVKREVAHSADALISGFSEVHYAKRALPQ
jgi:hypothetical protein